MKKTNRILSLLLALILCFSQVPVMMPAGAESENANPHYAYVSTEAEFLRNFTTAAGWERKNTDGETICYEHTSNKKLKDRWEVAAKNVTLTNDITLTGNTKDLPPVNGYDFGCSYRAFINGDTVLDLNGHTLDLGKYILSIYYYGPWTLTITDSSPEHTGKIISTHERGALIVDDSDGSAEEFVYGPDDHPEDPDSGFVLPTRKEYLPEDTRIVLDGVEFENMDPDWTV